jgi:hypothetical protein
LWKTSAVPGGATLSVSISGGTGDADLYVNAGAAPTTSTYVCRLYLNGNSESCSITTPAGGASDYYIMLRGYAAFSGVTLRGSHP